MPRKLQLLLQRNKNKLIAPACDVITSPALRILDYDAQPSAPKNKRALLSYLTQPVFDEIQGVATVKFSNDGIARSFPKVLNKLGYVVDIINWDDTTYQIDAAYDLAISHGAINFDSLYAQLDKNTHYLYFSTGSYWKFHNRQEERRFQQFEERHSVSLSKDRYITNPEEKANTVAKGIICLGNEATAKTYADFANVRNIPIGCYPDGYFKKQRHDYEANRKNFLFFSGSGNIHKGLDLLLDVFANKPDYTLHICTFLEDDFKQYYSKILQQPNIVVHDFVELQSAKYYEIIDGCNYIIFPSCSEGSPGSVVESMMRGLIPIVSETAHIDVGTSGVLLDDTNLDTLEAAITTISSEPIERLKQRSRQAYKISETIHSPKSYELALLKAIQLFTEIKK